ARAAVPLQLDRARDRGTAGLGGAGVRGRRGGIRVHAAGARIPRNLAGRVRGGARPLRGAEGPRGRILTAHLGDSDAGQRSAGRLRRVGRGRVVAAAGPWRRAGAGGGGRLMSLDGRRILVGLSGGIACYRACEVVRRLARDGARVRVVMTAGAREFVTPLTLQTLSGQPVATDTFSLTQESEIGHIRLADEAEAVLIAPATANVIAKLAHGVGDDLLCTVLLATRAPLLLAPAMNVHMWEHAATQANLQTLVERGAEVVGPGSGSLACGYEGTGRLAEPPEIVEAIEGVLSPKDLRGERVLVSAGPTREAIDPVRYLSNHSSGKMGDAIARVARRRGAEVVLVTGPTSLPPPPGVRTIAVTTAAEMQRALETEVRAATVLVMAAAVADHRVRVPAPRKMKKGPRRLT